MTTVAANSMTRAEWIAIGAFALNVGTVVFLGGVVWGDVQDHEAALVVAHSYGVPVMDQNPTLVVD